MATLCLALAVGCTPRPSAVATKRSTAQAASPLGWRCPPRASACVDRAAISSPFKCTNDRCVQMVVRRAARNSSSEIHQTLFPDGPPPFKTVTAMDEGIRRLVRKRHARH